MTIRMITCFLLRLDTCFWILITQKISYGFSSNSQTTAQVSIETYSTRGQTIMYKNKANRPKSRKVRFSLLLYLLLHLLLCLLHFLHLSLRLLLLCLLHLSLSSCLLLCHLLGHLLLESLLLFTSMTIFYWPPSCSSSLSLWKAFCFSISLILLLLQPLNQTVTRPTKSRASD